MSWKVQFYDVLESESNGHIIFLLNSFSCRWLLEINFLLGLQITGLALRVTSGIPFVSKRKFKQDTKFTECDVEQANKLRHFYLFVSKESLQ